MCWLLMAKSPATDCALLARFAKQVGYLMRLQCSCCKDPARKGSGQTKMISQECVDKFNYRQYEIKVG